MQENWADVSAEQREDVLAQLRYYRDVLGYLEAAGVDAADAAPAEEQAAAEPEPEPDPSEGGGEPSGEQT